MLLGLLVELDVLNKRHAWNCVGFLLKIVMNDRNNITMIRFECVQVDIFFIRIRAQL